MSTKEPMTQEQIDAIRVRVEGSELPDDKQLTVTIGEENLVSWAGRSRPDGSVVSGAAVATVHIGPRSAEMFAHAPADLATLLAEVERLRALTTVDDAMVERAARSMSAHWHDWHTNEALGRQRALARVALDAALGTGEEA